VRGTPGVTASFVFTGVVDVTFPRDVSHCTWIATQGNPANNPVSSVFAAVRGAGSGPQDVEVVTFSDTGAQVDANFHLAVIC
jgi:hypothetical protein